MINSLSRITNLRSAFKYRIVKEKPPRLTIALAGNQKSAQPQLISWISSKSRKAARQQRYPKHSLSFQMFIS